MTQSAATNMLTIGHSTHEFERFVALLKEHRVTALGDVRSSPYSRMFPQYGREALQRALKEHDIGYVFLGGELGARSDNPECYVNGKVQYGRIAATDRFQQSIQRVIKGASRHRIALMCAEKDPLECHRTLLVAKAIVACGQAVGHILADGGIESHDDAMSRLLVEEGYPLKDMYLTRAQLIEEATKKREHRVAYVDETLIEQQEQKTA
jgi:uncharacterized protein (DUF488 family)